MEQTARVLAKFASVLAALDADLEPASRLCESARQTLGADSAALAIRLLNSQWSVLWATDPSTEQFEHMQQLAGEGPARDAAASGELVFVPADGTGLETWATLSVVAERDVIRGNYWVVPMRPVEVVVGVLTLRADRGELGEDLPAVQFIADTVGTALMRGPEPAKVAPLVDGDWTQRAEIHQATGMVVAQLRISPDDALTLLRAHAFAQNRELHHVALDVVARRIDFSNGAE